MSEGNLDEVPDHLTRELLVGMGRALNATCEVCGCGRALCAWRESCRNSGHNRRWCSKDQTRRAREECDDA